MIGHSVCVNWFDFPFEVWLELSDLCFFSAAETTVIIKLLDESRREELMLLAVEGGGFFSSSASGYSKGLTLLLLGRKTEDKPMRVAPWNHYQLVEEQDSEEPDIQLASGKKGLVQGCASLSCFGRTATGLDSPCALKVGPIKNLEILPEPPSFDGTKDRHQTHSADDVVDSDHNKTICVKSSLKKSRNGAPVDKSDPSKDDADTIDCSRKAVCVSRSLNRSESAKSVTVPDSSEGNTNSDEDGTTYEKDGNNISCQVERRTVQWMDTIGGDLFEIREFEMSEDDSDNEFNSRNGKTCLCRIM